MKYVWVYYFNAERWILSTLRRLQYIGLNRFLSERFFSISPATRGEAHATLAYWLTTYSINIHESILSTLARSKIADIHIVWM